MRIIKIKQQKQDNGLWGTPMNCVSLELNAFPCDTKDSRTSEDLWLLESALIAAFGENYPHSRFSVKQFVSNSIQIRMSANEQNDRVFRLGFDKFGLDGNTLYQFENSSERMRFFRKQKIKRLYDYK